MKLASSEARKTIAPAISPASAARPDGSVAANRSMPSSPIAAVPGVRVGPGETR
ncbi:MAG TPA: hypothetical protein VL979_05740 [Solirubrobacteraceae bacterium]|nr:hypothetical protein [Solirubrobacteraceae bacterium]